MAARTHRHFNDLDKKQLLTELEVWRHICTRVCAKAPIGGSIYKMADKLIHDIDTAVETLTGDRQFFYGKGHSSSSSLPNGSKP